MSCNLIVSCRCNTCHSLVTVTSAAITAGKLVLTIPSQSIANNQAVCLLIATTLPASATPIPVVVSDGTTQIPLINKDGHLVYSDQISNRKIYPLCFKSDVPAFDYVGKCNLPCTCFVFTTFTPTPAPSV